METYLVKAALGSSNKNCPECIKPRKKDVVKGDTVVFAGPGTKVKLWRGVSDEDGLVYDFCPQYWWCGYRKLVKSEAARKAI